MHSDVNLEAGSSLSLCGGVQWSSQPLTAAQAIYFNVLVYNWEERAKISEMQTDKYLGF